MWRKPEVADIQVGTAVRFTNMADTPFNGATIIAVKDGQATVARPMAYAHGYNERAPMLYAEVFSVSVARLCGAGSDAEVWESPSSRGILRYTR